MVLLVQEFLPDMHKRYLFENYKMTSSYRQYKSFVPDYLHDRPRSVIKHCLERKSNGQKYLKENVSCVSDKIGVFHIKGTNTTHCIDFGKSSQEPSCTYKDWLKWKIPCKHFFGVFNIYPEWNWHALPKMYLCSEYLSSDPSASISSSDMGNTAHFSLMDDTLIESNENDVQLVDVIPSSKVHYNVWCNDVHFVCKNYYKIDTV